MGEVVDLLPLVPAHVERMTVESGISIDVCRKSRCHSITDPKAAAKLLGRAGHWDAHLPVLMIPYYVPYQRDPVRWRGRPAKPFETPNKDGTVSLAKYVEAKHSGVRLYFGPSLLDESSSSALKNVSRDLWITEGEFKCLSAESAGLACIAVSGVTQWHLKGEKTLHPDFSHVVLEGRRVFLAFDRDAVTNLQVRKQEIALGRALLAAGAKVFVVRFPEDAPKLDDFLVRHERTEIEALMKDALARGALEPEVGPTGAPAPGTELTDLANAERFAKQHGDDLRYCAQLSAWFRWDGKRWVRDETEAVMRRAMMTARSIYLEADALQDPDARSEMREHARKTEHVSRLSAMIRLAGALKRVAVTVSEFDADPWLLNVDNGTLDLRNGELLPHSRERLITKLSPVHYDPAARHDIWDRFIAQVTSGDADTAAFLQAAVGYSLTGDTREDRLFFIYGPPARGKSTFVAAVEAALGDYARTADISTFLSRDGHSGGDKPRPDLVRLAGARICVCKEIDAGARLAEGLVKTVTGGDVITVRNLHSQPFEMRPSFKLWLVANDAPVIRGDDAGMWRRMIRIPFDRPVEAPSLGFREALQTEPELRAAVLAWAVGGVKAWRERGLVVPEAIRASTAEYQSEMDHTGGWVHRFCVFDPSARTQVKQIRAAYEEWSKDEGHLSVGARRFKQRLRAFVIAHGQRESIDVTMRGDNGRFVDGLRGIRLRRDSDEEPGSWGPVGSVEADSVFSLKGDDVFSNGIADKTSNLVPTAHKVPTRSVNNGNNGQNGVGTLPEFVGTVGTFESKSLETEYEDI